MCSSKEILERDCCGYAYEYLREGKVDKAVQILSTVKDPANVNDWLKEVLWGTFDVPAREAVTTYLRANNQLTDEDGQMLDKLWKLLDLHPGESFTTAFEKYEKVEGAKTKLLDAIQSKHSNLELSGDLSGICAREGKQSLWEGVLSSATESKLPEGKGRQYPYMRMTGEWINDLSAESLGTLLLEGESLAGKGLTSFASAGQWKPAFLYYLSHHMVDELLGMVASVPADCISKEQLKVYDGQ